MNCSPQPGVTRRAPRFRLTDTTLAVLRLQNGSCVAGDLHVISCNGGLLLLPQIVGQGSIVQLMFHTHRGTVVGTAEMLTAVNSTQQPFRFITLAEKEQRTLHAAFQSHRYRNTDVEERIEELKAVVANAVSNWNPSPWYGRFAPKLAIGVLAIVGCLAWALYAHLLPH
jgi:hypothetical protein